MEEEMETYELTISVDLPRREMGKILSLSQGILKQMCFRGIFELLYRGTFPINGLEILPTEDQQDARVRDL